MLHIPKWYSPAQIAVLLGFDLPATATGSRERATV
jgi:hypothetical protein